MKKNNIVLSVFFFFVGVLVYVIIPSQIPNLGVVKSGSFTPASFPRLLAILMIVFSLGLLLQSVLEKKQEENTEKIDWKDEKKVLVIFLMILAYVFLLEIIGFILASIIFGTAFLFFQKVRKWHYYIILYLMVIFVYFSFSKLLFVYLPSLLA